MGALFEIVRQRVSAEDAARMYGLDVSKSGKARCPFHDDHHPSLSFNRRTGRFHCFACGMGGGSVDIAAKLLNCSPLEAALQINRDFDLGIADAAPARPAPPTGETPAQAARRAQEALAEDFRQACEDIHQAHAALERFTPASATDPAFSEALSKLSRAQDRADALLAAINGG